jgi:hypothetical protein
MQKLCVCVVAAMLFYTPVFAQDRGIELQGGGGYVFDSGEGPSVPALNGAAIAWLTRGWGLGARLTEGVTSDQGNGDLRIWALTSQWRWFGGGTEVNLGVGVGGSGWRRHGSRSGVGFIAIDLLIGRRISGAFHVKGGFTLGLMDDSHPVQPVMLVAWTP